MLAVLAYPVRAAAVDKSPDLGAARLRCRVSLLEARALKSAVTD